MEKLFKEISNLLEEKDKKIEFLEWQVKHLEEVIETMKEERGEKECQSN